jgi:hypothetical protein
MKFLLTFVFLSVAISANATSKTVDLNCLKEGSTSTVETTLIKETGDSEEFTVTTREARLKTVGYTTIVAHLPVSKKSENQIDEMVYSGTGYIQRQIDVFEDFDFTVRVPRLLQNGVTVTYYKNGKETDRARFNCTRSN